MIALKGKKLYIEFNAENGRISSLKYEEREFIGGSLPLFKIKLLDKAGEAHFFASDDFTLSGAEEKDGALTLLFSKDAWRVSATVTAKDSLDFGITVGGCDGFVTEWVEYPGIAVPDALSDRGGDGKIFWGFNEGATVDDMDAREKSWFRHLEIEYPSNGQHPLFPAAISTQFMAYYDTDAGLYLGAHDKEYGLKGIDFYRAGGGISLCFKHFTGADFGCDFTLPYPVAVNGFVGDWQDGCEIYRAWFEENTPSGFVKIKDNKSLPEWYGKSPVIVTYPVRGKHDTDIMTPNKLFPYINVMPTVEKFEKALGSRIMIILMHWEGTAPWAPPIVWPPYGGEEKLRELIDALHERGDVLGVYCSGIGWTINSNLDEYNTEKDFNERGLWREMCTSPKGDLPYSKICTAQRSGYDMCPTREFTKATVRGQVKAMADAGIDYIQLLDQNHGGTSYLCYSREHGHPPVPGRWQVEAQKTLLKEAKAGYEKLLLGCESAAAESYIPELAFSDNRFELGYALGRPTPIYAYLFHEYLNNFMGNQVCADYFISPEEYPLSYYERLAYSFTAGDLLTLIINEDGKIERSWGKKREIDYMPNEEDTLAFVYSMNYFRRNYPEYLHTGRMIKSPKMTVKEILMPRSGNGVCRVPAVHSSSWESEDGSIAHIFTNWQDGEERVTLELDTGYTLIYSDGTKKVLGRGKITLAIPRFTAVMTEKKYEKN